MPLNRPRPNRFIGWVAPARDLPEILALSHRVLVLREGRVIAHLTRDEATPDSVLRALAGITDAGSVGHVTDAARREH